jgi:1,4-alpha-glucan branching enzyme
MLGSVAIVLHAHLPYVHHPEHERSLEERWLFEALWECYLPLLSVLDRLAADGVRAPFTLSISPPLAAMLRDEGLAARFDDHLSRLARLAEREVLRFPETHAFGPAARFYVERLAEVRATWERVGRDVLSAFVAHARDGRVELWTSSATHAYLPGLLPSPASIRAQLRLGLRSFERLAGVRAKGLWLPECAYDPRFDGDLAKAGARVSVLDAHGLELATPAAPRGIFAPVRSPSGVVFFGRDPVAAREVWSRKTGYPGDFDYREFHRDIGFDRPLEQLEGHVGPHGTRVATGIKLHRITGGDDKAPYDRALAVARAHDDALDFVERREEDLADAGGPGMPPPVAVTPYDAELFGHWWFEGPEFLEAVLRALDASAREGRLEATTLGAFAERAGELAVATPAASSWGEGGYGEVWAGRAAAPVWRHVHHAHRAVERALERAGHKQGPAGRALEQAIRELMLLEASDWPFMIHRGETAEYALARVRAHHHRATRLSELAENGASTADDIAFLRAVEDRDRLFAELTGEAIRDAFDEWF